MSGKPAARIDDGVGYGKVLSGSTTVFFGDDAEGKANAPSSCQPSSGCPVNPLSGVKLLPAETDFALAAPATVMVVIDYGEREFRLRVCDDGRGLDEAVLRAGGRRGHFGLPNMRERAERLGARLSLRSCAGAGTEIELRSVAVRSYVVAPRRGLRWRWC